MCEIAIIDPERYSASELKSVAMTLYESMRSSLGVLTVKNPDDTETFEFDVFRDTNPDPSEVLGFAEAAVNDDDALRVIIHGRLATQGEVIEEHAHPLSIDCDQCDVDYVLHNGIITGYRAERRRLEDDGHDYQTDVDSEVLAHDFGTVPDSFEDGVMQKHGREPAFVLANEDRVFIRASGYQLAEDGRMARLRRDFGPSPQEDDYGAVIIDAEKHSDDNDEEE